MTDREAQVAREEYEKCLTEVKLHPAGEHPLLALYRLWIGVADLDAETAWLETHAKFKVRMQESAAQTYREAHAVRDAIQTIERLTRQRDEARAALRVIADATTASDHASGCAYLNGGSCECHLAGLALVES